MPASLGEMFWTGEAPWHGRGRMVERPLTWEEALSAGGLDWSVEEEKLLSVDADEILSPVPARKSIVRSDVPPGREGHVLGVVHDGFVPLQNRRGIEAFDRVFGRGLPVYETGGWLGRGEKIWLLARVGEPFEPLRGDRVDLFVLFANSHDGSLAIRVRLTTIRVVCQNTFVRSLSETRGEPDLRLAHSASPEEFEARAVALRGLREKRARSVREACELLARTKARPGAMEDLLKVVFPFPKRPGPGAPNRPDDETGAVPGVRAVASWARRMEETRATHAAVRALAQSGRGSAIVGVRGSLWGIFNAVAEYVDHDPEGLHPQRLGPGWSLLGDGAALKAKAWDAVMELAKAA